MFEILFFLGCFFSTFLLIPKIIGIVRYKNLLDHPNERSSHSVKVPTLGGLAFYVTLNLSFFFLKAYDTEALVYNLLISFTVLFVFGLKDDLVVLSPYTKLLVQIFAVTFIIIHPNLVITSLNGFLGIYEIPYAISTIFAGILMVAIINSYNLIDGIDGLAGLVGIVISSAFAYLFYLADEQFYFLLSLGIIACLLSFLRYNLSKRNKIFMGDTGSLLIGFLISVFTLKFLSFTPDQIIIPFKSENTILVLISILVIPFFDTLRVMVIRMANNRGPFRPDRKHIHHILIDYLSLSHMQASVLIGIANILIIIGVFLLSKVIDSGILSLIIFSLGITLFYIFYRLDYSLSNIKKRIKIKQKLRYMNQKQKKVKSLR